MQNLEINRANPYEPSGLAKNQICNCIHTFFTGLCPSQFVLIFTRRKTHLKKEKKNSIVAISQAITLVFILVHQLQKCFSHH